MNASWRAPMVSAMVSRLLLVASVARANPCPLGMTRLPIFSRRRRSQPTGSAPTMAASSTLVARSRSQTGSESGGSWIVNPGGSLQFDTGGTLANCGLIGTSGWAAFAGRPRSPQER